MLKKILPVLLAAVIGGSVLFSAVIAHSKSELDESGRWVPLTEIEFIVPSSPGGGSDTNARMISDIAFKNGYSPRNFTVNNMPGGSGAVAFSYMATKEGQENIIMVLHSGQIMSTLTNKSPVIASDLTFLPIVAFDNLTLCIQKDGRFQSIEELVAKAKTTTGEIRVGGSQRGNSDHLSFELLKKGLGINISYVQYNSSGEVMSALLGGHVDFGIFNPSECIGQMEAKEIRPVATFATERLSGVFSDVPTFIELGYPDVELAEVRAISGTPGLMPEAIEFYDEMFKKVTEDPRWQTDYIEKNYLTPVYMSSAEAKEFFELEIIKYNEIFREVGLIK